MFFVGMSKSLQRMGGVRIGAGLRVTRRNFLWIALAACFVMLARLMWQMIVLAGGAPILHALLHLLDIRTNVQGDNLG